MKQSEDDLIRMIFEGGGGSAPDELLNAFFNGYPIENLRILLTNEKEDVVKAGVWIASELGSKACGLKDDFLGLMRHSSRYVRFFVLDCVLACASSADGELISSAICAVVDVDEAVRWKALKFISMATDEQLGSGATKIADEELAFLAGWIAGLSNFEETRKELQMRLASPVALHRLFGVAGAVRRRSVWPELLETAAQSTDPAVATFAVEQLKMDGGIDR